jgi:ribosomal protein S18 acetylase RimI-like enzyme
MTEVRRLIAEEWELMRDIRLRALADTPAHFGSSLAREVAFTEQDWRGRFATGVSFIAFDGDKPVGLVGGMPGPAEWRLVSMWVAPQARGRRVAGLLIDAVVAEAVRQGASTVVLDVLPGNSAAYRAYERHGFVVDEERSEPDATLMCLSVAN